VFIIGILKIMEVQEDDMEVQEEAVSKLSFTWFPMDSGIRIHPTMPDPSPISSIFLRPLVRMFRIISEQNKISQLPQLSQNFLIHVT